MILKKSLVLCALAIGFINSAMSATVLQCPVGTNLLACQTSAGHPEDCYQ